MFRLLLLLVVFQQVFDYTGEQEFNLMNKSVSLGNGSAFNHTFFIIDSDIDFDEFTIELNNSTLIIPDNRKLYLNGLEITEEEAFLIGCFKGVEGTVNDIIHNEE
jgi:hypothetical protein